MSVETYSKNDSIKLSCNDCIGCHSCCTNMGNTIVLTPYDIFMLYDNMGLSFEELLEGPVELSVKDGLVLPNLKMIGNDLRCGFLGANNRCNIHDFRPDICRLFPLARHYNEDGCEYFLMENSCPNLGNEDTTINQWLSKDDMDTYEQFIVDYHKMLSLIKRKIAFGENDASIITSFLKTFFQKEYETNDFFEEFYSRKKMFEIMNQL